MVQMDFKLNIKLSSLSAHFCLFICFFTFLSFHLCNAQNATTDPSEVTALNLLFEQWNTKAVELWNISGEPCSGSAINQTDFEDPDNNPAIKCDCTYNSSRTCHITQLRVYALQKRGEIPEVILAFKYLTLLKIDQNYFTGPLPAFMGNLSTLKSLSIAHNAFYGSIPKELGNLKELTLLSIGVNNFSGTLPPEIGNLVKLEEIYINSCGLGGEIPSTFAQLQRMRVLSASDSPFSGKIPEFIGNWTMLQSLRFQGNSFEGPIPSSFSNLVSLTSLWQVIKVRRTTLRAGKRVVRQYYQRPVVGYPRHICFTCEGIDHSSGDCPIQRASFHPMKVSTERVGGESSTNYGDRSE